jgi:hypothetical protein
MGWDPWQALHEQPEIELMVTELPGGALGLAVVEGPHRAILLEGRMSRVELRSALAHELIHLERGIVAHRQGAPPSWSAVVAREERHVDDVVAARLVPADDLADLVAARAEVEPVTPALVAAEFDVTEGVARRALEQLAGARPHLVSAGAWAGC